ncbi:MAG: hypothetical protein JOZ28_03925 [Candidatus Eremiobacteraeota bacterium]|nr:hypothetical protein [Candidatus Eremiobacteraeota bacterium]
MIALALVPPPLVIATFGHVLEPLSRCWYFFCSMLVGAAPFLTGGALGAAVAQSGVRRPATRQSWIAIVMGCVLLPVCDCCMNAAASALRAAPRSIAAFALVWGSCCNPVALWCTALVLGWRITVLRVACALVVAAVTASVWTKLPDAPRACSSERMRFTDAFVRGAGGALSSFALAAAVGSVAEVYLPGTTHEATPLFASVAGAILSPCSSADALLARTMFASTHAQLAFIVASQCADLRQLALVWRWFGAAYALTAALSAAAVIAAASHVTIP